MKFCFNMHCINNNYNNSTTLIKVLKYINSIVQRRYRMKDQGFNVSPATLREL